MTVRRVITAAMSAGAAVLLASGLGTTAWAAPPACHTGQAERSASSDGGGRPDADTRSTGDNRSAGDNRSTGDNNRGDVWLQDDSSFPGHQEEPHLGCGTVYVYGAGLADGSGVLTIDSWPPSGSQAPVPGFTNQRYTYDTARGGNQVIFTFQGRALVAAAVAAGATSGNPNGFHFKLDVNQGETSTAGTRGDNHNEQKHKVFWVNCPAPTPAATAAPTAAPTETPSPSSGGVSAPTAAPAPTSTPVAPAAPGVVGSVQAVNATPVPTASEGAASALSTPTPSPTVVGGVQGLSTSAPDTGAGIRVGLAACLLVIGAALLRTRRLPGLTGR